MPAARLPKSRPAHVHESILPAVVRRSPREAPRRVSYLREYRGPRPGRAKEAYGGQLKLLMVKSIQYFAKGFSSAHEASSRFCG